MLTQSKNTHKPMISAIRIEFSPLSLARMIWKQKVVVIAITLVLSATTLIVVHRLPAIYKAEAVVLVDSQKIPEKYVSSTVNADVGDRLATIKQQILSSTALKKVIDDFDLYHDDRKTLAFEEVIEMMLKDIDIKLEKGWTGNRPGAFHVGYRGPAPVTVAGVANRIANLFVEGNLRSREIQAEGTSEFIVSQLQSAKTKLDEIEATLSRYKLEHNGELPQQENSLIGTLARLQMELQGNQEGINRAQQNKVMLATSLTIAESAESSARRSLETNNAPAGSATDPISEREKPSNSQVVELQLEVLRGRYGEGYPEVQRMRRELERVRSLERREGEKNRLADAVETAGRSGTGQPAPAVSPQIAQYRDRLTSLKAQLALTDEEITRRSAEVERVGREIALLDKRVDRLPVREQEMAALLRDYEISKANYKSLLDKKLAADMASEMERRQKAERFTIIDPARVPEKPFQPNRRLLYGAGCALSLALGVALALARELKQSVLLGEWELPPGTVILGRIPRMSFPDGKQKPARPTPDTGSRTKWWPRMLYGALILLLFAMAGVYAIARLL